MNPAWWSKWVKPGLEVRHPVCWRHPLALVSERKCNSVGQRLCPSSLNFPVHTESLPIMPSSIPSAPNNTVEPLRLRSTANSTSSLQCETPSQDTHQVFQDAITAAGNPQPAENGDERRLRRKARLLWHPKKIDRAQGQTAGHPRVTFTTAFNSVPVENRVEHPLDSRTKRRLSLP
jgi:hypothetical protein